MCRTCISGAGISSTFTRRSAPPPAGKPVMAIGRIATPAEAEAAIAEVPAILSA